MKKQKFNWKSVRKLFPATKKYTYINAAEGSPVSMLAAKAGKQFYDEMLKHGDLVWEDWLTRVQETRKKVAKFIGANEKEIAFTLNTSHGMNLIAQMLKGKGSVLTMSDEFPSSTFPWMQHDFKVKFVEPEKHVFSIKEIEKNIDSKTKILVTSYVQYCTGFKQNLMELGKLCKRKGLIFVVNATQAMGAMPIDVEKANIDFLVFTSLKWPMAGYGIGGFYMKKKWISRLKMPVAGWQSVDVPEKMDNRHLKLRKEVSALEVGCPHFPNIFALGGAIDLLNMVGKKRIQQRIYELDDYLVEKLKKMEVEIISPLQKKYRSGITIIKVKNPAEVVEELFKKKIVVSKRGEGIRISMHIYNNKRDVDVFVKTLNRILKRR